MEGSNAPRDETDPVPAGVAPALADPAPLGLASFAGVLNDTWGKTVLPVFPLTRGS